MNALIYVSNTLHIWTRRLGCIREGQQLELRINDALMALTKKSDTQWSSHCQLTLILSCMLTFVSLQVLLISLSVVADCSHRVANDDWKQLICRIGLIAPGCCRSHTWLTQASINRFIIVDSDDPWMVPWIRARDCLPPHFPRTTRIIFSKKQIIIATVPGGKVERISGLPHLYCRAKGFHTPLGAATAFLQWC
jgi:hypothetical protein